jgi:hypothetical protein
MSNPMEAVFLERDRLLKLKAELSTAVAHARAAAWRVEVFHPDRPPLVDQGVLQEMERLAGVIGLQWVFLTSENATTTRPRWSCTVLPEGLGAGAHRRDGGRVPLAVTGPEERLDRTTYGRL